jgi:hypothetical protein
MRNMLNFLVGLKSIATSFLLIFRFKSDYIKSKLFFQLRLRGKKISLAPINTETMKIIKSFCGGPGGGFLEKSPLAAGGKGTKGTGKFL